MVCFLVHGQIQVWLILDSWIILDRLGLPVEEIVCLLKLVSYLCLVIAIKYNTLKLRTNQPTVMIDLPKTAILLCLRKNPLFNLWIFCLLIIFPVSLYVRFFCMSPSFPHLSLFPPLKKPWMSTTFGCLQGRKAWVHVNAERIGRSQGRDAQS